ncbi:CDP-diacylglycerol--inositol 3-phosphatidyltransferase [Lichtheimia hyalospora FSU 10163]|nr:CDP-diacylglycerol--inositol 3-phosphatidyltransferase [Lichtheimia hyalospora FSU 10163]
MSNGNRRLLQTDNVFLYIPNIIGYTRIILASAALYYMPWHPKVCTILYCISCLLDAVDGNAARYFDQCSKFGAVLDMVTDSSMTEGSSSHKKISESSNRFLQLYYNSNIVLFIMCAGNELFFVALYVFKGPINATWWIVFLVSGVICFLKQFINVIQIVNASRVLATIDKEERAKALNAKKE